MTAHVEIEVEKRQKWITVYMCIDKKEGKKEKPM